VEYRVHGWTYFKSPSAPGSKRFSFAHSLATTGLHRVHQSFATSSPGERSELRLVPTSREYAALTELTRGVGNKFNLLLVLTNQLIGPLVQND